MIRLLSLLTITILSLTLQAQTDQWSNGQKFYLQNTIGYSENGYWGIKTVTEKRITFPLYSDLYPFQDNYLIASKYNSQLHRKLWGIVDTKGVPKTKFEYNSIQSNDNSTVVESKSGFFGLLRLPNKLLIDTIFTNFQIRDQVIIATNKRGKKELFNIKGKSISNTSYDFIGAFVGKTAKAYVGSSRIDVVSTEGIVITQKQDSDISTQELIKKPTYQLLDSAFNPILDITANKASIENGFLVSKTDTSLVSISHLNGNPIIQGKNIKINSVSRNLMSVAKDEKHGIINSITHEIVFPFVFDSTHFSSHFIYTLRLTNEGEKSYTIYNYQLEPIHYSEIEDVGRPSNGLLPAKKNGYWGCFDLLGNTPISFKYDSIGDFINGLSVVRYVDQYGVINEYGDWVIPPYHLKLDHLPNHNLFISTFKDRKNIINEYNNTVFTSYYEIAPHPLGFVEHIDGGLKGLFDKRGNIIGNKYFQEFYLTKNDSAIVFQTDEAVGIWDIYKGYWIIDVQNEVQSVVGYGDGLFSIGKNNRYGAIDFLGRLIIANRYDSIGTFLEGVLPVKIGAGWGTIEKTNESIIVQPTYQAIYPFRNGTAVAQSRSMKYGLINKVGTPIISFKYDSLISLEHQEYFFGKTATKIDLLNKNGDQLSTSNDAIARINNDTWLTVYHGKYGLVSNSGRTILPNIYARIQYYADQKVYLLEF